jgi:predicted  nucleic acid-binding Zn-ribbon protein
MVHASTRTAAAVVIACALVVAVGVVMPYRAVFESFRAWDRGRYVNGEGVLREAVAKCTGEGSDVWKEMFARTNGGQLFVAGEGPAFNSSADVFVNPVNPYASYFPNYDGWARKMRALAMPATGFDSGTVGVFCGRYETAGGPGGARLAVFTVCADAASAAKRARCEAFVGLLNTVVLMESLDRHLALGGEAVRVSAESERLAEAHAARAEAMQKATANSIEATRHRADERIARETSVHEGRMRAARAEIERLDESVSGASKLATELKTELDDLMTTAAGGEAKLDAAGSKLSAVRMESVAVERELDAAKRRLELKVAELRGLESRAKDAARTGSTLIEGAFTRGAEAKDRRGRESVRADGAAKERERLQTYLDGLNAKVLALKTEAVSESRRASAADAALADVRKATSAERGLKHALSPAVVSSDQRTRTEKAPAVPTTAKAPERRSSWTSHHGVKYRENDASRMRDTRYKSKNIDDGMERCTRECENTPGCKALTVHDPNNGKTTCVMYRDVPGIEATNQARYRSASFT